MLKKLAVISLTAGALVLSAPAVASAAPADIAIESTDSYAETPRVFVDDPVIGICEVSTIVFGPNYFVPNERVAVSVSGTKAADSKISGNIAAADGGLVLSFRPPTDGEGKYAVSFGGAERSYTATISVTHGHDAAANCDHDPGVAPAGTELPLTGSTGSNSGDGFELALTGGNASPWLLGGGALAVAAGGALLTTGLVRRKRA